MKRVPLAVVCGDLHLSHTPPLARARERDWYGAMGRALKMLGALSYRLGVPVLCAGDVFDRWNPPPELVSFAIEHLPRRFYTVAGQHDLPMHNMGDLKRSALYTLICADAARLLSDKPIPIGRGRRVVGASWGEALPPGRILVVHRYVWTMFRGYDKAAAEDNIDTATWPRNYRLVITGDNHIPFQGGNVFNCGGFMRRKSDDVWAPRVGVLHSDYTVDSVPLPTDEDVFEPTAAGQEEVLGVTMDFVEALRVLHGATLDFEGAVRKAAETAGNGAVREVLLEALEHGNAK